MPHRLGGANLSRINRSRFCGYCKPRDSKTKVFIVKKQPYSESIKQALRLYYANYCGMKELAAEVQIELSSQSPGAEALIQSVPAFGHLYELPSHLIHFEYMRMNGQLEKLGAFQKSGNVVSQVLEESERLLTQNIDSEIDAVTDTLSEADLAKLKALIFANMGCMRALAMFGCHMYDLVKKSVQNDKALFRAVLVDSCVLQAPSIAKRVRSAELSGEQKFLKELAKSISKSKARRHSELDDLRLMLTVVDELCGLENLTDDELTELFVNELQLLSKDDKDPTAALKWHISERKKFLES